MAVVFIGFTSCQKDSELTAPAEEQQTIVRDGTQPGSLSANMRINTVQNPLKLAVQISEYNQFEKMTVKLTKWDYNNGHTPMIITGTKTYNIRDIAINQFYMNRNYSDFSYTGAMQVDIYRDTTGALAYTRYMLLTDSTGWTVNLDTTATAQSGWVGQNKIIDVIPKSYQ